MGPLHDSSHRPTGPLPLAAATLALIACAAGFAHATTRWVPQDFSSIQAAIDASAPGDSVRVAPGVYVEALTLAGKDLAILGAPASDLPVVVTTNGSARILDVGAGVTARVSGLDFHQGRAARGGAMRAASNVVLELRRCRFASNVAYEPGGLGLGGALYLDSGSSADLEDCDFERNAAQIRFDGWFASGGAIYCEDTATLAVRRSSFGRNSAQGFEGGPGGAIACGAAHATLDSCGFEENSGMSGAVNASGPLVVRDCVFRSNGVAYGASALEWQGVGAAALTLRGSVFTGNWSPSGTTVLVTGAGAIAGNTLAFNGGAGAACLEIRGGGASVDVTNNVVSNNDGVGLDRAGATGAIACNDVWGNALGNYGGTVGDRTGLDGNISEDPLYCDAAHHDVRLRAGSPCAPAASACGLRGARPVGCLPPAGVRGRAAPALAYLAPIAPNPQRGPVRFGIEAPRAERLRLTVLDPSGRVCATIADDRFEAGRHELRWATASQSPPGVYWALLQGPGVRQARRFLLLR